MFSTISQAKLSVKVMVSGQFLSISFEGEDLAIDETGTYIMRLDWHMTHFTKIY